MTGLDAATAATASNEAATAQPRPAMFAARRWRASSRRASGWAARPPAIVMAVARPAKPTERLRALVTSCGRTTNASVADPNTQGAAGATASQNRRERTARGGQLGHVAGAPGRPAADRATPVSGARQTTVTATTPSTTCGRYGSTRGSPAHWARTDATAGPSPKPADSATADRRALTAGSSESSCTQAVAEPNTTPEQSPASARPAAITASERGPVMNSSVATGDSTTNGSTTGRRPMRSETGPPMSSP